MSRHSSPRRLMGKRRRMESWESRDAMNARAGQERAARRVRQDFQWPLAGQQSAGPARADREEEPVE